MENSKSSSCFLFIKLENLKALESFPFNLYVFNPQSTKFILFLAANSPFISEKQTLVQLILDRGGQLAIEKKQKETFISFTSSTEEDFLNYKMDKVADIEACRLKSIEDLDEKTTSPFVVQQEFSYAINNDDFSKIIKRIHDEVFTFDETTSNTVSLAKQLSRLLLVSDNYHNRIVATSYFLSKECDIDEEETLADIICSAFFSNIGLTQLPLSIVRMPVADLIPEQTDLYKKHPQHSTQLLKASNVNISNNCLDSILDHHERCDGKGFPQQKQLADITRISMIIGAVTLFFEYTTGKIEGNNRPMGLTIKKIKNRELDTGLEFDFEDIIVNGLINLCTKKETTKKAA